MANRSDRRRTGASRSSDDAARQERSASRRAHSTGSSRPSNSSRASRTARSSRAAGSHAAGSQRSQRSAAARTQQAADQRRTRRTQQADDQQRPATSRSQRSANRQRSSAASRSQRSIDKQRASRKQRAAESLRNLPSPASASASASARAAGRAADATTETDQVEYESASIGQIRRAERAAQARAKSRRYVTIAVVAVGIIVALIAGWVALYNSSVFTIKNIELQGVEHLTNDEMAQLVDVPANSTLLRVDTAAIEKQVEQNAWVADAQVTRVFPDTLQVTVTERPIAAVVYISTGGGTAVKRWLISDDHVWLMPVPDADSEAAQTTSSKVYEDADKALHIVGLPYGTKAEIGKECTDDIVNNALDIVSGLTTDLSGRVAEVSAPTIADTTLILDDGVEVAFGKAEDIRDKERVVLELLEQNPNQITYINVRMVEQATYRSV